MAEESEAQETGAEASGASVDPAALGLALAGASREEADAFLKKQRLLADIQVHHLHEQFKNLRLTIWEKRTGVLLRVATAIIGLVVAGFLGAMVWNAAQADGVVIEAFSVPPEFAARGLTGDVVAARLMDRLSVALTNQTGAFASRSVANGLNNDIKVEIPETGISAGEAYRFLRRWLGHETGVEGEVIRLPGGGVSLTVRVDGRNGAEFSGREDDINDLVQKAANRVAAVTSPANFATNLINQVTGPSEAEVNEAQNLLEGAIADTGQAPLTLALAMNNLGVQLGAYGDDKGRVEALYRQALALAPDYPVPYGNLASFETTWGHYEDALKLAPQALAVNQRAKGY